MIELVRHRGPDDAGTYVTEAVGGSGGAPGAALGSRRLAIIDRAGGHQPIANEDGSIWVVLNGEIYNYRELRHRLEGSGHTLRTSSDTETIVHLYEDEGIDFLRHLNGMFALAIWDERRRQLVLARDRLGKKPLVYSQQPGRLLFASELKSLLAVPGVSREINPQAVDLYLTYQYVPHPHSIFRSMAKLPPGHVGVFRDGTWTVTPYWRPDFQREEDRPWDECVARLRELLTSAVKLRLESEVPLGAFLSGGLDSSIIAGLMQRQSGNPINTFSIGFDVPEYDETDYAWAVARKLGSEHRQFRVAPKALDILPKLVWHFDEPFADSSAIPTYYVSQLCRQHVTVALTGDGGDELFAGYPRYRAVRLGEQFDRRPGWLRAMVGGPYWRWLPASARQKSVVRRFKKLAASLRDDPQRRYLEWISIFNFARRAELYTDDFVAQLPDADPFEFLHEAFARSAGRDYVTRASLTDLVTYLPCDLMTKVDIASMAHSVECRQPFLDYRVVEFAAALPIRYKLRLRAKRILREAFGDLLPRSVRRRGKMGFGVPLDHWFRGELADYVRQVLTDPQALGRNLFRAEAVERLLAEHASGRFDHSRRLWALLFLELWQRQWGADQR